MNFMALGHMHEDIYHNSTSFPSRQVKALADEPVSDELFANMRWSDKSGPERRRLG